MAETARWYVVHTYSGYENKVKANIEKTIENRNLQEWIHDIQVPVEEQIEETSTGKTKITQRKIFPGYVLIKMVMTDDSWYVVRNTRGVTGFVGPGSKPVPLTDEEVHNMGIVEKVDSSVSSNADNVMRDIDLEVGETVNIISGALSGTHGVITEIDYKKQHLKVLVDMFGRETSTELNFNQIEKIK